MLIAHWSFFNLFFLYLLFNKSLFTFPLTFHFCPVSPQLPLSHSPLLSLFSLPPSRSRSPACSRLCAISPYFSLVNILSRLSSIIYIPKEGLCTAVVLPALFIVKHLCFRQGDNLFAHFRRAFDQRMQIRILNFYQQRLMKKA